MLKNFCLILLVMFTLTGCKTLINAVLTDPERSHNRTVNDFLDSMELYCNVNEFKSCNDYRQCIFNKYKSINDSENEIYDRVINVHFPALYKKDEYLGLLDEIYKEFIFYGEDFKDEKIYFRYYSGTKIFRLGSVLYAHNSCASIIGDKTYEINEHINLIINN